MAWGRTNVRAELHAALAAAALGSAALIAVVQLGCGTTTPPPPARANRAPAPTAAHAPGGDRAVDVQEGRASYYGHRFDGRKTASGERYDPELMTAAHRSLPFGTRLRVTRAGWPPVVVRVNDRCGCPNGRIVDLSQAAARKLDMIRAGVVPVRVEILER